MTGPSDAVRELAEPLLAAAGLELWDVEVSSHVVRVLVDRPGGVDLEALSAASAALSPILDDRPDLVPADRYQFEVSSPGIERNLRTVAQYRRYVGQPVSVKATARVDGARRLHGILRSADDDGITLVEEEAAADAEPVTLSYDQIQRARTVLVWGPTPKPTGAKRSAGRSTHAAGPDKKDAP